MPLVLLRVDERLIHGQVVVGWGERLHPQRFVVADDELAASAWEQELYQLGLPAGTAADFLTLEEARARLAGWRSHTERVLVLVRSVAALARLAAQGALAGQSVNLGGVHDAAGRLPLLSYLFLSAEEQELLREVAATGARISAQDLPDTRAIHLEDLALTERL